MTLKLQDDTNAWVIPSNIERNIRLEIIHQGINTYRTRQNTSENVQIEMRNEYSKDRTRASSKKNWIDIHANFIIPYFWNLWREKKNLQYFCIYYYKFTSTAYKTKETSHRALRYAVDITQNNKILFMKCRFLYGSLIVHSSLNIPSFIRIHVISLFLDTL